MLYLLKHLKSAIISFQKIKPLFKEKREMNKFEKIIDRFNKKVVDPMNFEMTMEGYQEYLNAMGIKYVANSMNRA